MDKQQHTCVLVSDFNLQNFSGYLTNDPEFPRIHAITAPFGQTVSTLLRTDAPCWQNSPDVAVVWTQPQAVIPDFNTLLRYEQVRLQQVLQQVDEYSTLLVNMSERVKYAFVPSWVLPSYRSLSGGLDRDRADEYHYADEFAAGRKSRKGVQYLCAQYAQMD